MAGKKPRTICVLALGSTKFWVERIRSLHSPPFSLLLWFCRLCSNWLQHSDGRHGWDWFYPERRVSLPDAGREQQATLRCLTRARTRGNSTTSVVLVLRCPRVARVCDGSKFSTSSLGWHGNKSECGKREVWHKTRSLLLTARAPTGRAVTVVVVSTCVVWNKNGNTWVQ